MKKKEIIIIALVILITLIFSSSSMIISLFQKDDVIEEKEERYITITFKGELIKEVEFKFNKGVTFGYVYKYLKNYLNSYSIINIDFNTIYEENKTIYIESSDYKNEEEKENDGKIDLNSAELDVLTTIYGIGIKRANRIIEARRTKKISSWSELRALIEVSDEVISKIKEQAFL